MDQITVKDAYLNTIDTVNDSELTLEFNTSGLPFYNDGTRLILVGQVLAELESDTLMIHGLGSSITMNSIRATASAAGVSSFLSWAANPTTPGLDITITTPDEEDEFMQWFIGENVPPVKLNVKIVRR